jgi:hypothetical protein
MWTTPNVPGQYTIVATFHDTASYWGSYSETSMAVQSAASASPTPTSNQPSNDAIMQTITMDILAVGAAIIIVIALATILLYKKKT